MYYLPFFLPTPSPPLKESSFVPLSQSFLNIYPNSQPCIPESIVLAESPWSHVINPPACILTLTRQKLVLGSKLFQKYQKGQNSELFHQNLKLMWFAYLTTLAHATTICIYTMQYLCIDNAF